MPTRAARITGGRSSPAAARREASEPQRPWFIHPAHFVVSSDHRTLRPFDKRPLRDDLTPGAAVWRRGEVALSDSPIDGATT